MCEWGTTEIVVVNIPADLSHTGKSYVKLAKIDKCIAPIVRALNEAGIKTRSSCCGHGKTDGRIDLQDGRILLIVEEKTE
jgi:tRNA(Phe) wybutosine-synthesizing methylase Tyw3